MMDKQEEQQWMFNKAYHGVLVPKQNITSRTDLVPCSILFIKQIQDKALRKLCCCLFDSSVSNTLIHYLALPD